MPTFTKCLALFLFFLPGGVHTQNLLREKHQQHQQYQRHPNSTRTTSTPSRSRRQTVCQCASILSQKIPHWQTIATSCAASQPQPSHREQRSAAASSSAHAERGASWTAVTEMHGASLHRRHRFRVGGKERSSATASPTVCERSSAFAWCTAIWRRERFSLGQQCMPNTPTKLRRSAAPAVGKAWRQPARLRACDDAAPASTHHKRSLGEAVCLKVGDAQQYSPAIRPDGSGTHWPAYRSHRPRRMTASPDHWPPPRPPQR